MTLLRENIKEKDSQVTKSGNVKFFGTGDYLFDTYDIFGQDRLRRPLPKHWRRRLQASLRLRREQKRDSTQS